MGEEDAGEEEGGAGGGGGGAPLGCFQANVREINHRYLRSLTPPPAWTPLSPRLQG